MEPNGVATPKQVASAAVEASNLRSMSETRKAKFKRLLEQQVLCYPLSSALAMQCHENALADRQLYAVMLASIVTAEISQGVIKDGR